MQPVEKASRAVKSLSWAGHGPGARLITADSSSADAMTFEYALHGSSVWNHQTSTPGTGCTPGYVDLYTRNGGGGGWNVSGTASLQLHAGGAFGIIIEGRNYDSDARLVGNLKVTSKR